jgi:GTP-binding protein
VVNKTDGLDVAACVNEFARMGVDMVIPIAAAHQRGVPDLVQAVLPRLPADRDTALLADEPIACASPSSAAPTSASRRW